MSAFRWILGTNLYLKMGKSLFTQEILNIPSQKLKNSVLEMSKAIKVY